MSLPTTNIHHVYENANASELLIVNVIKTTPGGTDTVRPMHARNAALSASVWSLVMSFAVTPTCRKNNWQQQHDNISQDRAAQESLGNILLCFFLTCGRGAI